MSQGHPAYGSRNAFASSSKLPDRTYTTTATDTATQPKFARSAYSRRPEPSHQPRPQAQFAPQYGQPRSAMDKDEDAMSAVTDEQRDEIQEAFQLFDIDNDNMLSFQEMRVAFRALGFKIPRPELKQMMEANGTVSQVVLERNRQKSIEPEQYHVSSLVMPQAAFVRLAALRVANRDPIEEVERAYNLFDLDGKGYIVFEDLRRVAQELGETGLEEEELHAMINEFDFDGTGSVARETFYSILTQ